MGTEPISEFFDREACCARGVSTKPDLTPVSRVLLGGLVSVGVAGRSVLDLGCGLGKLATALLREGAARASGIDLSPGSIEVARDRARDAGLSRRATFEVGNAATADLAPHDVVVLDKVICCYPDPDALLGRSLPAAGALFAFSVPESRGLRGAFARIGLALENAWRRLRGEPFRAYVHDVGRIERSLREAGFTPAFRKHRLIWHVAVHRRD